MGLNTSTLDLIFAKGINTKIDPKLQLQGELARLENALFNKTGRINKRNGFDAFSRFYYSDFYSQTGNITSGRALGTVGDELVLFDGTDMYNYAPSLDQWINRGQITAAIPTNYQIIQNSNQQTCPDVAYSNGIEVHVREDSRNSLGLDGYSDIYYSVIDSATRTHIIADSLVKASAVMPRVFALGDYFVIAYVDLVSKDLSYKTLTIGNITGGLSLEVDVCTDIPVSFDGYTRYASWDGAITPDGSRIWFAYSLAANADVACRYLDTALSLSSEQTITATVSGLIACATDSENKLWIFWRDNTTSVNLRYLVRSSSNTQTLAPSLLTSAVDPTRITAIISSGASVAFILYEEAATLTRNIYVRSLSAGVGGSTTSAITYQRSVGLASKIWEHGSRWYVVFAHESEFQTTYFVHDFTYGKIIAKILPGNAGGLELRSHLPSVVQRGADEYLFPNTVKGQSQSITGEFFSLLGINLSIINFNDQNAFSNAELGESLLITGGMIWRYDGADLYEHNFMLYPEDVSASQSNTANGALTLEGFYRYKVVYECSDNKGIPDRSTPSPEVQITLTGVNDTVTLTIPTLRLTNRTRSIKIDVYRTTAGGDIFYKLTGLGDELYNPTNLDSDEVTYVDEYADSEIDANEPLYTEGQVYHSSPPSAKMITVWKNRAWLAGLEDPHSLWYSKLASIDSTANFNDTYTIRTNPAGGIIKDICPLGQFLVIFKETAIYTLFGNGPNNSGTASDYGEIQVVSTDLGAKFTGCTVETPDGIMFVSQKGIYLINRSGQVEPIGKAAEDYQELDFCSAVAVPDKDLAIFGTRDGYMVVYDWFNKQWLTWTINEIVEDLIIWDNELCCITSDGYVLQYGSTFVDTSDEITMLAETGWFTPAGQSGYCLLESLTILGDYKSGHTLKVVIYKNFSTENGRTFTINATGAHSVLPLYQFKLDVGWEVNSFKVVIFDDDHAGSKESFTLSGMRIEVAPFEGANRAPAKARIA